MLEKFDLLQDIAERTKGVVYLGVVGPVRTGKSTFIKRFMESLVLPNIVDENDRERTKDALPQSGAGRTIMTIEPKFIPDEAVEITIDNVGLQVRMVDCVGYAVKGARGYMDEAGPRMVETPWSEEPMTFEEASELGTRKVIAEHSTVGLVITTDGTITEIPRDSYVAAEERVVEELRELGKPYIIVLNSADPFHPDTLALREELEQKYQAAVIPIDCSRLNETDIQGILREILYEFPIESTSIALPNWVDVLERKHTLRRKLEDAVQEALGKAKRVRDIDLLMESLGECDAISEVIMEKMQLGSGVVNLRVTVPEQLYYEVLSEAAGTDISDYAILLRLMKEYAESNREYVKIKDAVRDARNTGYGIVPPSLMEMVLDEPEIIRQGNRFGVRLKASAPAYHMIRVDVQSEVTPIVGTEKQSEELIKYLIDEFESSPQKLWEANIFGKSLHNLVTEGIQNKLFQMPDNAQEKLRETLQRIVNEGSGGLIAIIL